MAVNSLPRACPHDTYYTTMGSCQNYFKKEFNWSMFFLNHHNASHFYISRWQNSSSCLPLLLFRSLLFLLSLIIVISHMAARGNINLRYIYLTHWGLLAILLTTAFSLLISARCYLYGPIDCKSGLPWYVKVYWLLFNISAPTAFMITLFFYAFLSKEGKYAPNEIVNIMIHLMNAVIMFLELMSSSHPSRLLHIIYPFMFGCIYILFGLFYYLAGGTDPNGHPYIYPMVDWTKPLKTSLVITMTMLFLLSMHLVVVILALLRNGITRFWMKHTHKNVPRHLNKI